MPAYGPRPAGSGSGGCRMLELAVQGNDAVVWIPPAVGAMLAAFFAGLKVERRRNGRRNNPGTNANDYRYGSKRGSDCKPGLGAVCLEHGQSIRDNEKLIVRLTTLQETGVEQGEAVKKHMAKTNERLEAIEAKLPGQDMSQKDP